MLNLSENEKKTGNNIDDVLCLGCVRELYEETNIKLSFTNKTECVLDVYGDMYDAKYTFDNKKKNKAYFNINMSCKSYDGMKQTFMKNKKNHHEFMMRTGEISAIAL